MEVYRYIIKTNNFSDSDVLDHVLKGHGFHTQEAAENKLKEKIAEAVYGMKETDFWTQRNLHKMYQEEHDKYKDAVVVKVKVTVEVEE